MIVRYIASIFILLFSLYTAHAEVISVEVARKAVTQAEWAEGVKLHDYELIDQDGVRFHLHDYFKQGKPLLVSFIYTHCADVCPLITTTLIKAVKEVKKDMGDKFNVLIIGFDTERDTPEALKVYSQRYLDTPGLIRFATSDKETMEKLLQEFGFYYKKRDTHGFTHLTMVSVVDETGVIYKQVYGFNLKPDDIRTPLMELLTGNIPMETEPTFLDRLKQLCTVYDPVSGTFVLNWPVVIGFVLQIIFITGILIVLFKRPLGRLFSKVFSTHKK